MISVLRSWTSGPRRSLPPLSLFYLLPSLLLVSSSRVRSSLSTHTYLVHLPLFRSLLFVHSLLILFSLSVAISTHLHAHMNACTHIYTRIHIHMHEFVGSLSRTLYLSFIDSKTERAKSALQSQSAIVILTETELLNR